MSSPPTTSTTPAVAPSMMAWVKDHLEKVPQEQLSEAVQCSICFDTFNQLPTDSEAPHIAVRATHCNHIFGSACIQAWALSGPANRNRNCCPVCRTKFFEVGDGDDDGDAGIWPGADEVIELPAEIEAERQQPISQHRQDVARLAQHISTGDAERLGQTAPQILLRLIELWVRGQTPNDEARQQLIQIIRAVDTLQHTLGALRRLPDNRLVRDARGNMETAGNVAESIMGYIWERVDIIGERAQQQA